MSDPKPDLEALAELTARYKEAFERGDLAQAEEVSALIRAASRAFVGDAPEAQEMEKVGEGERLILMERWAEARDVLASIDRSLVPLMNRPGVLNNLAYATAQAGDPERAIELILNALKEAEAIGADYPPEKLPFMRATHAIALSLAGKHEDAIAMLEPLVEIDKPVRARSTRAYFLAQSYRALVRTTDAARAFELAADGEGAFAKRAEEALAAQHPQQT
jgi:tetratricopeptide (TPR) repeat protein